MSKNKTKPGQSTKQFSIAKARVVQDRLQQHESELQNLFGRFFQKKPLRI